MPSRAPVESVSSSPTGARGLYPLAENRERELDIELPSVSAADFPICCRSPRTSLRSTAATPPSPPLAEADVIIIIDRPDRPSSIVRHRICEQQSAKKNWRCRPVAAAPPKPACAGRSASELAGTGARLARAREHSGYE